MSQIEHVIGPKKSDLGDNFVVRRFLPRAGKRMVGPFIFWDHMGPVIIQKEREMKVRSHPHIGLATITYLFKGEILHRDSLGNEQFIKPGEVNWMTAGRGIVHSERSLSDSPRELEGIQLWVALPSDQEEVEPRFDHFKEGDLPDRENEGLYLRCIAGEVLGLKSPVPVYSDLFYLTGCFRKTSSFEMNLSKNQEAAVYVVKGQIEIEGKLFSRFSMVTFHKGSKISFAGQDGAEFMFFGGEVFPEKRHIWWNFVSSRKERIEEAKRAWRAGEFQPVINETEVIPLPED